MRIIREKSIEKSAFHIGKVQYALMNGDEGERLDALEDLAELTLIIGGMSLLKICTPSMPIENRTQIVRGRRERTMSEMIVKLNADKVKLNGCEYVQDLVRCGECIRWTHHGGWTMGECERWREQTDGTDFCSYAERKE